MEKMPSKENGGKELLLPVNSHTELFREFPPVPQNLTTLDTPFLSPYKSAKEKLDYERRLPIEILPFVRTYFAQHKDEMLKLCENEPISEYLSHIKEAWQKHIGANEAIDCFLNYETKNVFGDWSQKEWGMAKRLIVAAFETDHQKTMYSGGIKHKLEIERIRLGEKYRTSGIQDFDTLLISPAGLTFYEGREHNNKKLHLSILKGEPDFELKNEIVNRYNGGDQKLFEERFKTFKFSSDIEKLESEIQVIEERVRSRSVKKNYALVERQELKDFDSLLFFDNTTEYEYTYSLKGLQDLFLREELLKRLKSFGQFPADTSVYSLSKEDFVSAIDDRLSSIARHSSIRLRPYLQTMDTCGTACIMSILNRKGIPLTRDEEMAIWERVGKPYNFPGGLATVLLEHGFHVKYIQNHLTLLQADSLEFESKDPNLLRAAREYVVLHEKAIKKGLNYSIESWDFEKVKVEISRGNPCILYIYVSETYTHCVIARGIKNNRLEIIDPLGNIKYMNEEQLNKRIDTPMGRRMLVVEKLPDDFFEKLDKDLQVIGY